MSFRMTAGAGAAALALALFVNARHAAADSLDSTRTDKLVERRHSAVLTLSPERAELVVQRVIYNESSTVSDQATFMIELPEGAVATRLRTRGTGPGAPWFEGELLEAEQAAAKYRELTGLGGFYPKDPALLSWRDQQLMALQVFPCPPRTEKWVQYTLDFPLEYREGAYHLRLPRLGTQELSATVQLFAKNPADALTVDAKRFSNGATLPVAGDEPLDIALRTRMPLLASDISSQSMAEGRALTHYAVRAAPRVSSLPKQAYVVLVVDGSRSTFSSFGDSAKSALGAYLTHIPDAHVQLVTFDREVHRVLGGFVSASDARAALRHLSLPRSNGSAVDRALFEADELLASSPAGSPRRIVLVTDGLTRASLTPERLGSALSKSGALLHVGLLGAGDPSLARTDTHAWSGVVRATGGVVWEAEAPDQPQEAARLKGELGQVYEEWARPLRIDHLSAYTPEETILDALPSTLAEGEGTEMLYVGKTLARVLNVSGELWSTPIKVVAHHDAGQDKRWAALVFGSPVLMELSEPEMMALALVGRAVSPVTSYLAIEPGVRPSTDGLTDLEVGEGFGVGGLGLSGGATDYCGVGDTGIDRQAYLETTLRPELVRCGGKAGSASVELETTRDEIVDVKLSSSGTTLDAAIASCMIEAVWALLLPGGFQQDFQAFTVQL